MYCPTHLVLANSYLEAGILPNGLAYTPHNPFFYGGDSRVADVIWTTFVHSLAAQPSRNRCGNLCLVVGPWGRLHISTD